MREVRKSSIDIRNPSFGIRKEETMSDAEKEKWLKYLLDQLGDTKLVQFMNYLKIMHKVMIIKGE